MKKSYILLFLAVLAFPVTAQSFLEGTFLNSKFEGLRTNNWQRFSFTPEGEYSYKYVTAGEAKSGSDTVTVVENGFYRIQGNYIVFYVQNRESLIGEEIQETELRPPYEYKYEILRISDSYLKLDMNEEGDEGAEKQPPAEFLCK